MDTYLINSLDWLAYRASLSPNKVALIFGEQHWTYRELNIEVGRICGHLIATRVQTGQHVAVLMPNQPEYVYLVHGLARLGATLVPLNTRLTTPELRWQVEQAECSFVICADATEALADALGLPVLNVERLKDSNTLATGVLGRPLDLEAVQGIIFTSGTTGQPKGAMLTYSNFLWSAIASAFRLGTDPADRWLVCLPLYHVGGLSIIFRCCLYGTAVVLQSGFDVPAVSQALESQKVTLVSLVPTMLHRLLESKSLKSGGSLHCILMGGAALSPALLEQSQALKLPIAATYGLTEAASQVATASPAEVHRTPGHVGPPLMFSTVQVVGSEWQELPPGEIGEVVVSGPTVMRGYYRRPDATRQTLRGGKLHTGDLGYLDETGNLWLVQRRTDLIVSGGENVYPSEVEQALRTHPAIEDACVVGLPDAEWGQCVAAAVIRREQVTEAELVDFCRTHLAGYKRPRLIRFVTAFPATSSGKVQRDAVRQLLQGD